MRIILDANIFFAAILKNSGTRKIILDYDGQFIFPNYILEEFEKYKFKLFKMSGMTKEEFSEIIYLLLTKVLFISNNTIIKHKQEAIEIVKDLDINDAMYFACALAYPDSIIWSEDKKLKQQNKIKVLNTNEIIELLYKNNQ